MIYNFEGHDIKLERVEYITPVSKSYVFDVVFNSSSISFSYDSKEKAEEQRNKLYKAWKKTDIMVVEK